MRRCEISRCCLCDAYNASAANAYIPTMLISSGVLIIKCDDAYNAIAANVRSRDAANAGAAY